jgi:hypothetical protein
MPMVLNHILIAASPALLQLNAGLQIELAADPRNLSVTNREADIALRMARPTKDFGAVTRLIGVFEYAVYAATCSEGTYDIAWSDLRWMAKASDPVLLSFAQFEREVTGERIRAKIAASKKKGHLHGGHAAARLRRARPQALSWPAPISPPRSSMVATRRAQRDDADAADATVAGRLGPTAQVTRISLN